ncbi:FkbM family methyltransferase, partial [Acinetobacter baumannii]
LDELLRKHCPSQQPIHFLTVDVEGFDLQVIQSNDWKQFRPQVVVVECLSSNLSDVEKNPVYQFLSAQKYVLFAKTFNSHFFSDSALR